MNTLSPEGREEVRFHLDRYVAEQNAERRIVAQIQAKAAEAADRKRVAVSSPK